MPTIMQTLCKVPKDPTTAFCLASRIVTKFKYPLTFSLEENKILEEVISLIRVALNIYN